MCDTCQTKKRARSEVWFSKRNRFQMKKYAVRQKCVQPITWERHKNSDKYEKIIDCTILMRKEIKENEKWLQL